VAPLASEWIHVAALAIKAEIPLAVLRAKIPQFPSFSEGYLRSPFVTGRPDGGRRSSALASTSGR
jgi:dihydrolipoamide dehydrogenase